MYKKNISGVLALLLTVTLLLTGIFSAAAASYVPGTYEVTKRGMGGKIQFEITFSEDAITGIEAVKHHETAGLGDRALENVIPAILEKQSIEVDGWSGATITSDAIKAAVAEAMEQAAIAEEKAALYTPGTYEVTKRGMGGKIQFEITFSEDAITGIEAVKHHETAGLGDRALENVIPAILEKQSIEVDGWSGATITSDAIKAAVAEAMEQAAA